MGNSTTQISNSLYDQFIAYIEDRSQSWPSSETGELSMLRQKAFEQFKVLGFPSVKVEDWKYTNLVNFLKDDFDIVQNEEEVISVNESVITNAKISSLDCYTIVLLNGKYLADLSDIVPGEGIQVLPINNALNRETFKTHFGKYVDIQKNHFAALNTALFQNGLYIEVKSKTIVHKPIHIIHISSGESNLFLQPRHLFVIGSQVELSIIESYITVDNNDVTVFVNSVAEIVVGDNAKMNHYHIQTGNNKTRYIQQTEVHQQTSSLYNNYKASFPGIALLRNNLNVILDGTNTESHLYGIYLAGGRQLVDNHTIVDHLKPNCMSNELYKGVMKDESTGIFNGKIFVRKQAQKTNAFQKNNNLMLSKKATVDSKPQLEIFADDVKCSHGSTIGQFNEEALFYLKSRGIGDEKAKALLIQAFVFDVTEKIPVSEIRTHINQLIEDGLKPGNIMKDDTTILKEILNIQKIRNDFPILTTKVNGKPLVYFDNAATSQKPWPVIKAIENYYTTTNSNVHRGVHYLSQRATDAFEVSRKKVTDFINARHDHEVIFTKGTTESINLVAYCYGKQFVQSGDEIIISAMEHHSNIVPWQILCEERNATLKIIPINAKGELLMDEFKGLLNEKVKLVAVTYVSNSLGTINPVQEIITLAHKRNIPVLLDAAQAIQHMAIDVQQLDVDFLAFSGHKMYGPTGVGVLYGKEKWLNQMPPYQGGGEMIKKVSFKKTTYNELPFKFEAGTPNIEAAICLGTAIDYINSIGLQKIQQHEHELLEYATEKLLEVDELRIIGTADNKASVVSFIIGKLHPYDVGVILDQLGIAVRTGHHCTEPLMDFYGIPGTVRASFSFYNTKEEIDELVTGVKKAATMLQ